MFDNILDAALSKWLQHTPSDSDHIVISSRIRLARNFRDTLFTNKNDGAALHHVDSIARGLVTTLKDSDNQDYYCISLDKLSDTERAILVEKHLISPVMAEKMPYRSLLVSDDASVAIMVNEEDHLRIQTMEAGLNLIDAFHHAERIDDAIDEKQPFAFNESFGYLTACPTNVGTGLRASVMLHLPALAMTGRINRLVRSIVQLGYSVRGLYGEGSDVLGHMYQVSNQRTMGISEADTIEHLTKIVEGIIAEERKCRQTLVHNDKAGLEDHLWRSYGVLRYARSISGQESLEKLSDVQLGVDLNILPVWSNDSFNELVAITRPNFLLKYMGKEEISPQECDNYRATVIREKLSQK